MSTLVSRSRAGDAATTDRRERGARGRSGVALILLVSAVVLEWPNGGVGH